MAISVEANNECYSVRNMNCPIFVSDFSKFAFYLIIFTPVSTTKFHGNLSGGRRAHLPVYRGMHLKQISFNSYHADVQESLT
jgi:hypothetical protein